MSVGNEYSNIKGSTPFITSMYSNKNFKSIL